MRRPLSGALLGVILGLAGAVLLQQHGIWPLDRLAVFFLPGLLGLVGLSLTSVGRTGSRPSLVIALLFTLAMATWGALDLGEITESGQLKGGCRVNAASDVDSTIVTDTTRIDPFQIDPRGGLSWVATSPEVFDDYSWIVWTEIGGFRLPLASAERENNDTGAQMNGHDVPDVVAYGDSRGVRIEEIRGTVIVGGEAAGTCDGFAFVELTSGAFETLASQIALAVAALSLIALVLVALAGRRAPATGAAVGGERGNITSPTGAGTAAGLAAAGRSAAEDPTGRSEDPAAGPAPPDPRED